VALVAVSLTAVPALAAVDVGTVRLPASIQYQGKTIEKGRYQLSIGDSAKGPTIVLSTKDGRQLVDELAITQEAKKVRRPAVSVHINRKDEKLVRITVRSEDVRYLAYFEMAE
jgi:hypothetical protein